MKEGSPAVSVILPVYNTEKYLPRCLDSLLGQTFSDFEILAVDNGSADGSAAILHKYAQKDSRVRVLSSRPGDVGAARNAGLKAARGRYVMFCDSDDWVEPEWIETLFRAVLRPGTDMAVCNCTLEAEPNNGRDKAAAKGMLLKYRGKMSYFSARRKLQRVLWNKIFDLDVVRREDISFPEGREHDDNAFIFMYFSFPGTVRALKNRRLYHYVLRADSLMGRLYRRVRTGHEMDQLYSRRFVYEWLVRRGYWNAQAAAFLAELHQELFWCSKTLRPEDLPLMAETAIALFSGITLPPQVAVSQVIQAILHADTQRLLSFLSRPDETVTPLKYAGIKYGRKIQGWTQEKLYIFGLQVYKRYAAFCGGQRFILGLPAGRVLTGRQPEPKEIKN